MIRDCFRRLLFGHKLFFTTFRLTTGLLSHRLHYLLPKAKIPIFADIPKPVEVQGFFGDTEMESIKSDYIHVLSIDGVQNFSLGDLSLYQSIDLNQSFTSFLSN